MLTHSIPRTPRYIKKTMISGRPSLKSVYCSLAILMVIYVFSIAFWRNLGNSAELLPANPYAIFEQNEYWRLLTGMLIHADLKHFLSNAMMFFVFSVFLNSYFGFFVFPISTLILGAITNYLSLLTYPPKVNLIGASGIVYVMAGLWLCLFLFIDRRHSKISRLVRVTAFTLLVLFPSTYEPNTSYRTHALGFAIGVAFGLVYFLWNKNKIRSKEVLDVDKFLDDISDEEDSPT